MSEITVIFAIFLFTLLIVLGGYLFYSQDYARKKKINYRLQLLEQTSSHQTAMEILRRHRAIGSGPAWLGVSVHKWIVQTGLNLEPSKVFLGVAAISAAIAMLSITTLGFDVLVLAGALVTSALLVFFVMKWLRSRRVAKFSEQLPDALDMIVLSLRAGHPLQTALTNLGKQMADPIGTEFGMAADEVSYGLDLPVAMQNLSERVGHPDLDYLVAAVSIQSQSGGNLGEVLSRLSTLIRDRLKLQRKIRAISAQGRGSALVLEIIPIVVFIAISFLVPSYFGEVWDNPTFRHALAYAAVLMVIGHLIIRRMIDLGY